MRTTLGRSGTPKVFENRVHGSREVLNHHCFRLDLVHVGYESLEPWPLESIESKGVPNSERVTKMKLSADKRSIQVNESLTLSGIPPETVDYRLGSRSALEWIVDQYQVKGDSDPNREEEPGYIVRLVGQVVRVSVGTVEIVNGLPHYL
jgi:predicted helicase